MAINEKWDRGWGAIMLKLWGSAKPGAKKDDSLNEINSIWKQKAKEMHWNGSSVSWSIVKHHPIGIPGGIHMWAPESSNLTWKQRVSEMSAC